MLLVAALLAPAILASGMLMADFTGYGERARAQLSGSAAVRAAPARAADQKRAETTAETGEIGPPPERLLRGPPCHQQWTAEKLRGST